ncbi:MAG: CHAT domain-containing protein, partial [Planctomycetota bacterium]
QAWVEVVRGMVLASLGKEDDAQLAWRRGSLVQGYDHPLTGLALLSLGRAALADGEKQIAEEMCLQAAAAAAEFGQLDLVGECFNQLSQLHLQGALGEEHGAFVHAIAWANRQRSRVLRSQLLLDVAEQLLAMNRAPEAAKVFADAMKGQGRRARVSVQQAAKQSLVEARLSYLQDKPELGDRAISKALETQRQVSTRQFQIQTADRFYRSGSERLTPRAASFLYAKLLREPTPTDWQQHLLDTLVFQTSPLTSSFENWFEVALERSEDRAAVDVIQLLKRHRFLSQLPLGGRLLSLRWVMEAPPTLLAAASQARRDELLLRFPEYAELSRQARQLQEALIEEVTRGEDQNAKKRIQLSKQLTELSALQESMLADIALRNEFVPIAFPPQRTVQEVQLRLNPAQVVWGFCEVSDGLFSYMVSSKYVAVWEVARPKTTMKAMAELLNQIGMRGPNQPMTIAQLSDPRWELTAGDVLNSLLEPQQRGFWNRFEELIVVPDGRLWYFPFELAFADDEMLIERMRIRYAPLLALTVTTEQPPPRAVETVTALGQLFPREADEVTRDHFEQMQRVVDDLVLLPEGAGGPTRVAWQRLLVLDDVNDTADGPLNWSPARVDQGRPGSTVADWIRLPWGGPPQILLPGFHTVTESGGMKGDGTELFNTMMALMSTGARTVILSRWRTGGETSYDLMREWLQECDVSSASQAWQRAVQVVRDSEVDPSWEPRVTSRGDDPVIQAEHPFLWAGYLVVDTGVGTPTPLPRKPDDTKTAAE